MHCLEWLCRGSIVSSVAAVAAAGVPDLTCCAAELDVPEVVGRECVAMTRLQRQAGDAFGVLETAQANLVSCMTLRGCQPHTHILVTAAGMFDVACNCGRGLLVVL